MVAGNPSRVRSSFDGVHSTPPRRLPLGSCGDRNASWPQGRPRGGTLVFKFLYDHPLEPKIQSDSAEARGPRGTPLPLVLYKLLEHPDLVEESFAPTHVGETPAPLPN